jgi:UrcA family protein
MLTGRAQFHSRVGAAVAAAAAVTVTAIGIAAGIRTSAAPAPTPGIEVAYAGLDLSRRESVQLLYGRLQQASSMACGALNYVDGSGYGRWQRCYDGALQRAVLQVDTPELLAIYRRDAARSSTHG